eukprot:12644665-Alexandrium_andersonii.AAC.1
MHGDVGRCGTLGSGPSSASSGHANAARGKHAQPQAAGSIPLHQAAPLPSTAAGPFRQVRPRAVVG